MPKLPIITYPNKILEKKSQKIKDVQDPAIQELILNMLDTLEESNGLGLAAPQVGKSLRLCIAKLDGQTHILINPKIISKSWRKFYPEEGCLSFPGKFFITKRHKKIKLTAIDRHGKKISLSADGLLSQAFQHEIDHLDGVLFTQRKSRKK